MRCELSSVFRCCKRLLKNIRKVGCVMYRRDWACCCCWTNIDDGWSEAHRRKRQFWDAIEENWVPLVILDGFNCGQKDRRVIEPDSISVSFRRVVFEKSRNSQQRFHLRFSGCLVNTCRCQLNNRWTLNWVLNYISKVQVVKKTIFFLKNWLWHSVCWKNLRGPEKYCYDRLKSPSCRS